MRLASVLFLTIALTLAARGATAACVTPGGEPPWTAHVIGEGLVGVSVMEFSETELGQVEIFRRFLDDAAAGEFFDPETLAVLRQEVAALDDGSTAHLELVGDAAAILARYPDLSPDRRDHVTFVSDEYPSVVVELADAAYLVSGTVVRAAGSPAAAVDGVIVDVMPLR